MTLTWCSVHALKNKVLLKTSSGLLVLTVKHTQIPCHESFVPPTPQKQAEIRIHRGMNEAKYPVIYLYLA